MLSVRARYARVSLVSHTRMAHNASAGVVLPVAPHAAVDGCNAMNELVPRVATPTQWPYNKFT
jgi:hypothetical protein